MNFDLKEFQVAAARSIIEELAEGRGAVERGKLQAAVLSAPTGSGKTITVAAIIDWILGGAEGVEPRPQTTFLWLSDSPELNVQSKGKLIAACEQIPFHRLVTIDSDNFDEESLQAGHVYFINTQLLGKDKLLTKHGDRKTFTFWETIANTVASRAADFVLIIDEAHRGAGVTERARKPIMQKFITGSPEDGLPPVPLVLGMSATPQRFTELLGSSARTQRPVHIAPEAVRKSGLLKDLIVVHSPNSANQSDLTLLEQAAARWKGYRDRWQAYCEAERERQPVRPVLVIQVEDGSEGALTKSPLHDVVRVIERQMGTLATGEIVHCFQERDDLQYGGRIIRRMEPSRIQETREIKVVLFKTALTTGWDCPRAEVMMSFRRSQDATSIAQLVGRMVRTPLARRIERDEVLNTVELFLPHYDTDTLEAVLAKLRSPEEHDGPAADVVVKAASYPLEPSLAEVKKHLETLPTYAVERAPRMSETKRALRLANLLAMEGVDPGADERVREVLTTTLRQLRDKYAGARKDWAAYVNSGGTIDVDVTEVSTASMTVTRRRSSNVALSAENVDQLFNEAGRRLAAGEGLHRTYWKRYHDRGNADEAKLELAAVVRSQETATALETVAREQFDALWRANKDAMKNFSASDRARVKQLAQASGRSTLQTWELPDEIVARPVKSALANHLYRDAGGAFHADLNTWEAQFLEHAAKQTDFVCWLRNMPRKDWALCIPYDHGGEKPFYPDFIVIRRKGKGFEVDLVEPHDDTRTDTWAKAKGLAKFADEHHLSFGRMVIGRLKGGALEIVDVADAKTRANVRGIGSSAELEALFKPLGA